MRKLLGFAYETFSIRPGEGLRILLLLVHSLFIGLFVAFFTATAFALFLSKFKVSALPFVYIASALMGYLAVSTFSGLSRKVSFPALLTSDLGFLLVLIAAFWAAATLSSNRWIAFIMLVWIVPAVTLLELEFWGLAFRLFDLRQGKRLFGLVGTGEVVSSIVGYFLVPLLVRSLGGPVPLLGIAAIGLLLCIGVVAMTARRFRGELATVKTTHKEQARSSFKVLLGDRYFLLISAMMALFVLSLYIVDFNFLSEVPKRFEGSQRVASFIGIFFGSTKVAELLAKLFLSGRLVSQFGLIFGLGILPFIIFFCAVGGVLVGSFSGTDVILFFLLVAVAKLMWVVLKQAIFDPSFKVLFQPLGGEQRLSYQTRVEGTVRQLGVLLAGLLLLGFTRGGLGALSLFYLLVPLLAAWMVVVVMLHREYHTRLLANLQAGVDEVQRKAPIGDLVNNLLKVPAEQLENALAVLARVDAPAVPPLLATMVERGMSAAKIAALEFIARLKALGARPAVEKCLQSEPLPEVRKAAEGSLAVLRRVDELSRNTDKLTTLLGSADPADRDVAVSAIGFSHDPRAHGKLYDLLWDKDRLVRRAALVSAGRTKDPEYWHRIISELASPAYANAATMAAITVGEPLLPELEKAFGRGAQDGELRARILRIYERIGGTKATELMISKLRFPDPDVRRRALQALDEANYHAEGEAATIVGNEIEELVRSTAWNLAAILDIGEGEAVGPVRQALEDEVEGNRQALFSLLTLLYDPRAIALVRRNLERGSPEATVYALEILDLVVAPELKPLVLPVVEELTPEKCLKRLDAFFFHQRMAVTERLSAIVSRDSNLIGQWTKACALYALGKLPVDEPPADLAACLFHPDQLLSELAAGCMLERHPQEYRRHAARLDFDSRQRFDRLLDAGRVAEPGAGRAVDGWEQRSLFGTVRRLHELQSFGSLPWGALVKLATSADIRSLAAGDSPPATREPMGSLYFVLDGRVEQRLDNGNPLRELGPDTVIPCRSAGTVLVAEDASRLLRLDGDTLLELAADHPQLVATVLGQEELRELPRPETEERPEMAAPAAVSA